MARLNIQPRCLRLLSLGMTLVCGIRCASDKTLILKSDLESEVFLIDSTENPTQSLGKTPLRLVNPSLPLSVSFRRPGHESVDLIAFDESALDGEIQIKIGPPLQKGTRARQKLDHKFMDAVARAHRYLLRGQVADARRTLDYVEQAIGTGGMATLALRGHLELLDGHVENSLKYYQLLNQNQSFLSINSEGSP